MPLEITKLSPAIGAEIHGIDLSDDLNGAIKGDLLGAFHEHSVLLLRGQSLTERQLILGATWLGALGERSRPAERRREDNPFIMKVSNIRENGEPIGSLPDGEMLFHHDMAFVEKPHKTSFLYAVEVPATGGNTLFANMYKACDLVPQALKRKLAGRTALQVYDYTTTARPDIAAGLDGIRHFSHPVFITHPVTGREALYVNRLMTARIDGMDRDDSDAVLEALLACAEDPSIIYEHVWRPGDFIAWDNLCSTHARTDFPADQRRLLLRGMTIGERPRP